MVGRADRPVGWWVGCWFVTWSFESHVVVVVLPQFPYLIVFRGLLVFFGTRGSLVTWLGSSSFGRLVGVDDVLVGWFLFLLVYHCFGYLTDRAYIGIWWPTFALCSIVPFG